MSRTLGSPLMSGRGVSRFMINFFIPEGAKPRWYHLVAIVGLCVLLFAGLLGGIVDIMMEKYLLAVFAFGIFAVGVVGAIALRRAIARTVPPYAGRGQTAALPQGFVARQAPPARR